MRTEKWQFGGEKLDNGSWTLDDGRYQRKEIDVYSPGMGVTYFLCFQKGISDCPFATVSMPAVLLLQEKKAQLQICGYMCRFLEVWNGQSFWSHC